MKRKRYMHALVFSGLILSCLLLSAAVGGEATPPAGNTGTAATPAPAPAASKPDAAAQEAKRKANSRIEGILTVIRENEGDPAYVLMLDEELASLGMPAMDRIVARFSIADTPEMKTVLARAVARITGWYFPHYTAKDVEHIQEWWHDNRTHKAEELRAERVKDLLAHAAKAGRFIDLYNIVEAMSWVRDPQIEKALTDMLSQHDDATLRKKILLALGRQKTAAVVAAITRYVSSDDEDTAVAAITALGLSGQEEAKKTVAPFADSDSLPRKMAAILALGRLGDKSHVKDLRPIIENREQSKRIRAWALNILAELGSFEDHRWLADVASALDTFHFHFVGRTIERLVHKSFGFSDAKNVKPDARKKVIEAFKTWKVEVARMPIENHYVDCLLDHNWFFRRCALQKLLAMVKPGEVESEYDPISSRADCEEKVDPWRTWLEMRGDSGQ